MYLQGSPKCKRIEQKTKDPKALNPNIDFIGALFNLSSPTWQVILDFKYGTIRILSVDFLCGTLYYLTLTWSVIFRQTSLPKFNSRKFTSIDIQKLNLTFYGGRMSSNAFCWEAIDTWASYGSYHTHQK